MSLSDWQLAIKSGVVITNKSPVIEALAGVQEYTKQSQVHGFVQRYIPIELEDLQAIVEVHAEKGARSDRHTHPKGAFRYIMEGEYSLTYQDKNGEDVTINLEQGDWVYVPKNTAYSSEVLKDVRILHLYCVTNCAAGHCD